MIMLGREFMAWKVLPRYVGPSTAPITATLANPVMRLTSIHAPTAMELRTTEEPAARAVAAMASPLLPAAVDMPSPGSEDCQGHAGRKEQPNERAHRQCLQQPRPQRRFERVGWDQE